MRKHYKNIDLSDIVNERWLPVVGYEGLYEVSSFGRVKSLKRKWVPSNKILSQINHNAGYLSVAISDSKIIKKELCHILVAEAFIEKTNPNYVVNHKDGDKKNNVVSNLEWGTSKHNSQEAIRLGLFNNFGENHHSSILTNKEVIEIFKSNKSANELAKIYGICNGTVHSIKSGKAWGMVTGKNHINRIPKLTHEQILAILSDNRWHKIIAEDYGIGKSTVTQLKLGMIYSKITGIKYKKIFKMENLNQYYNG